jgi:formyltetrahydrofolate-dependent phosphoribosylglycinamide formyltransferase
MSTRVRARVAVLISGRGSNMEALVRASAAPDCPYEVVLVLSNRPEAGGLARAESLGVPARAIDHRPFGRDREAHERAIDAVLREAGAEWVALAGYMRVLTPFLVQAWAGRMLNIHPSLLPAFPGLDTHARALAAGVSAHGCTVHLVTEGVDEGPILGQAEVPVLPGDDADSLAERVHAAEHRLYPEVLARIVDGGARSPGTWPASRLPQT